MPVDPFTHFAHPQPLPLFSVHKTECIYNNVHTVINITLIIILNSSETQPRSLSLEIWNSVLVKLISFEISDTCTGLEMSFLLFPLVNGV